MPWIGHRTTWLLAGALAAIVPAVWMWGFTVDDALIAVRYARHVAAGLGWRFNAPGPSTDGVTPLPWPILLAPLAAGSASTDALEVLVRAKALGLALWAGTGAALGGAIGAVEGAQAWAKAAALLAVALSVPLAAYAVSGMETPLATALATGAVLCARRPLVASALAGLAASVRPEMAPWACVLAGGVVLAADADAKASADANPEANANANAGAWTRVAAAVAVALAPFAVCALVRVVAWGRPAPLAVLAKPSDAAHGLAYAGAACVVTLTPWLVLAPLALRRARPALAVGLAFVAHVAAVVAVGGDWMPFARLMVPLAPGLAWAGVEAGAHARPWATGVRSALALGAGAVLLATQGGTGRTVTADRAALVAGARPWLAGVHRVAALDVGWVGAATDADVVDLAGLTDPEVAALRGGHTSKRVSPMFLLERRADALLLYAPAGLPGGELAAWRDIAGGRVVEARLAADDVVARHFAPVAWLPLGARGAGYVLLRRRE